MRYTQRVRTLTLALIVFLAMAYLAFLSVSLAADSATTSANVVPQNVHNFIQLPGGDTVFNWDYRSQSNVRTNVDWGMRFIFSGNATVNKVKHRTDGKGNDPSISPQLGVIGSSKFAHIDDNDYYEWDSDRGKKNNNHCGWNWGHARFYSTGPNDYNYNPTLGNYIISTIHADWEEGGDEECVQQFRSKESDEQKWKDRIEDHLINDTYNWSFGNSINWQNAMSTTDISGYTSNEEHNYQSDGTGQIVNVP